MPLKLYKFICHDSSDSEQAKQFTNYCCISLSSWAKSKDTKVARQRLAILRKQFFV